MARAVRSGFALALGSSRRRPRAVLASMVMVALGATGLIAAPSAGDEHGPTLLISPTALEFGEVQVGTAAPSQTVDITNVGTAPVVMSGAGGGLAAPFSAVQNCQGNTLQPGESCQMTFGFSPTEEGLATATSAGTWNDQPFQIAVRGTGAAVPPSTGLLVSPTALEFGEVQVGTAAPSQTVDVTNVGTAPVVMSGAGGGLAAPFSAVQNCQGNTLQPGESCQMSFGFSPTEAGLATATSSGTWNDQPFQVAVRGTGIAPRLLVSPTALEFGAVAVGDTAPSQTVDITNVGTAPVVMDGAGGGVGAPFSAVQNCQGNTLQPGESCQMSFGFSPTEHGPASATSSGTWNGQAFMISLNGTTPKVAPSISTVASPGGVLGTPVRDVATLSGGVGAGPTGTVTFRLFSDATCTTEVFTSTDDVVDGTTATSGWFSPEAPGTYWWTAVYSGDDLHTSATSPCGAPDEMVTITAFQAPPFTSTVTGDFLGPLVVGAGESVLVTGARVARGVVVEPGGALTVVGSRVAGGIVADAPAFFDLCGTDVSGPRPSMVALTVTDAPVPVRAGDPAAGCAGNRIAGHVVMSSNLAAMFGANTVSHSATFDGNGPGNTVVKANTMFGALGCAGNDPAPVDAGQPNTAAAKTGQCASL
ncbi:MAG: choice-of-anchor D domain-containing protein [Actinomycetota bacterium]